MPMYEFACEDGHENEVIQKYDDPAPACSTCGKPTSRHMSEGSFQLMGGCWARDGYTGSKEPYRPKKWHSGGSSSDTGGSRSD